MAVDCSTLYQRSTIPTTNSLEMAYLKEKYDYTFALLVLEMKRASTFLEKLNSLVIRMHILIFYL